MATYTHEVTRQLTHRWLIPTGAAGACAEEVTKAWMAAEAQWRESHGLAQNAPLPGEALRFTPGDDHIAIAFTVNQPDA